MNKYQYTIDQCCGGPCINRKPLVIHRRPLSAIERMEQEQAEARAMYEELRRIQP